MNIFSAKDSLPTDLQKFSPSNVSGMRSFKFSEQILLHLIDIVSQTKQVRVFM